MSRERLPLGWWVGCWASVFVVAGSVEVSLAAAAGADPSWVVLGVLAVVSAVFAWVATAWLVEP